MTHFEVNYFEVRFLFLRNSHFCAKKSVSREEYTKFIKRKTI